MASSTYGEHTVCAASGGQTSGDVHVVTAVEDAGVEIVLGSGSFTRKAMLTEMGFTYQVVVAGIDEKAIRCDDPAQLVTELALAKADAIVARMKAGDGVRDTACDDSEYGDSTAMKASKNTLLITCDQVVVYDGVVREKPLDENEARVFIKSYGEKPVSTVGAYAVTDLGTGAVFCATDTSVIKFSPIPDGSIDELIHQGTCLECAGGLMVEHPAMAPLIVSMDGTMDGLMGLCKKTLAGLLMQALETRNRGKGE